MTNEQVRALAQKELGASRAEKKAMTHEERREYNDARAEFLRARIEARKAQGPKLHPVRNAIIGGTLGLAVSPAVAMVALALPKNQRRFN